MSLDERIDPFDLLSSYSAPAGWNSTVELTGPEADSAAVALLERVVGGQITATGPRRRHLRLVTGVIIAASLGGAAVAAATVLLRSPDQASTVACWSEPVVPPGAQIGLGWDGVGNPIELCAGEWQGGGLGSEGPPEPLQACVTSDGVAAVVPGDEATCTQLGLSTFAPIDASDEAGASSVDATELERRFASTYLGRCADPAVVGAEVRVLLDDLGFTDWDITIAGVFDDDEPCGSVSVDPSVETVSIVPLGRPD